MARSFREAEEASNAQGIAQAAVDWALQNATKNPTAENIAIAKDTYNAQQAMAAQPTTYTPTVTIGGAPAGYVENKPTSPTDLVPTVTIGGAPAGYTPRIIAEAQAAIADTNQTIEQINKDIAAVNEAGAAAGAISKSMGGPAWSPVDTVKTTTTTTTNPNNATTARDILRQALLETGMPADVAEASLTFVQSLIDDGITQADAIHHLYNFKDFTTKAGAKLTSPFYAKYTSLGEGLTGAERKSPLELMQFSLTAEKLVKNYGFSDKFASYDSLKKYVQNNVSATDLEPRMQAAVLKTTEADPTYVAALQKLGYISGAQDLADFFLDPNIGQQQLEVNRTAAAFAQANLQRSGAGLTLDPTQIKRISAQYVGMGDTKALATAAQGYETIGQTLAPEYQLATMYEQPRGTILTKEQQVELKKSMQAQLENEQFMGMGLASQERKKRLAEQAANAFQAQSGTYGGRSTSYSRQSTAGMI